MNVAKNVTQINDWSTSNRRQTSVCTTLPHFTVFGLLVSDDVFDTDDVLAGWWSDSNSESSISHKCVERSLFEWFDAD